MQTIKEPLLHHWILSTSFGDVIPASGCFHYANANKTCAFFDLDDDSRAFITSLLSWSFHADSFLGYKYVLKDGFLTHIMTQRGAEYPFLSFRWHLYGDAVSDDLRRLFLVRKTFHKMEVVE